MDTGVLERMKLQALVCPGLGMIADRFTLPHKYLPASGSSVVSMVSPIFPRVPALGILSPCVSFGTFAARLFRFLGFWKLTLSRFLPEEHHTTVTGGNRPHALVGKALDAHRSGHLPTGTLRAPIYESMQEKTRYLTDE